MPALAVLLTKLSHRLHRATHSQLRLHAHRVCVELSLEENLMKFLSALAVGLMFAGSVWAEDVALECQITESCDLEGKCIGSTENHVFSMKYENGDITNLDTSFSCGSNPTDLEINDVEISVLCRHEVGADINDQWASINRISGEYRFIFSLRSVIEGTTTLITATHASGICSVADRKF